MVVAVAYDTPIPGYRTQNTNTLRLWGSRPSSVCTFDKVTKILKEAVVVSWALMFLDSILFLFDGCLALHVGFLLMSSTLHA